MEISDETENLDVVLNGLSLCASSILANKSVDEHEECVKSKNKFFKDAFLMLLTVPNEPENVQAHAHTHLRLCALLYLYCPFHR